MENMEELIPIVGRLAEKYTAYEHTSIPYETAQQLMQAVLYCMREVENSCPGEAVAQGNLSALQVYEAGVRRVEEKVKSALALYNEISMAFADYGHQCLYDAVVKGLPEFFRRYDIKFCPQDTILTLDYPVCKDISDDTGIDKIYKFILCIQAEQKFLAMFPEGYVADVWSNYNSRWYGDMTENLCEIVLMETAGHVLAGKPLEEQDFTEEDYQRIQKIWEQAGAGEIKKKMDSVWKSLIQESLENSQGLSEYLSDAVDSLYIRLGNAAENGTLPNLF